MAMVQPRSIRARRWGAHMALIGFVSLIVFPPFSILNICYDTMTFHKKSVKKQKNPALCWVWAS